MRATEELDSFAAAVMRQSDIAAWHAEEMAAIPPTEWTRAEALSDGSLAPMVKVQAHIEGALHALRNAEDKFYECVARQYGSTTRKREFSHENVREVLERDWQQTGVWERFATWNDAFVKDVRSVRNIATYRADPKQRVAEDWHLQDPGTGTGYRGTRAAKPYCRAAAEKAREIALLTRQFAGEARAPE